MADPTKGVRLSVDRDDLDFQTEESERKMMPLFLTDEERQANVDYINGLIEADEARQAAAPRIEPPSEQSLNVGPTKGMRAQANSEIVGHGQSDWVVSINVGNYSTEKLAQVNAAYINWLLETDEKRRAHLAKQAAGAQDVLVDMGDMTRATLEGLQLGPDYESMTEDYIQNVNHIILQGIPPIMALYSFSQAFAIALGYALRANMPFDVAKAMITQVMKSATAAEKLVRVITKQ